MTALSPKRYSRRAAEARLAEQALAALLASRTLRKHKLTRHCAIGPYVVDYVYFERALVVDLEPPDRGEGDPRRAARQTFLAAMGYTVLAVSQSEVLQRPLSVTGKIEALLGSRGQGREP